MRPLEVGRGGLWWGGGSEALDVNGKLMLEQEMEWTISRSMLSL
jgi:hypothetical protein